MAFEVHGPDLLLVQPGRSMDNNGDIWPFSVDASLQTWLVSHVQHCKAHTLKV